jgi:DNA replication and repair protein RecF
MSGGVGLMSSRIAAAPVAPAAPLLRPSLWIGRLTLDDFRSYPELRLEASPGPIVLVGPNGAGKTNLIEALSYLSPGRGLRHAGLEEPDRRDEQGLCHPWTVAAEVEGPQGPVVLGTGHLPAADGVRARRLVKIDGRLEKSAGALAQALALAWLTPEMDRLFTDAAAARRGFFDRLAFGLEPEHARRLARHERARRERLTLLRAGRCDPLWLDALERELAEQGVAIAATRLELIARLNAELEEASALFPRPRLAIAGRAEERLLARPALAVEDELKALFAARRQEDAQRGTSEGAQRSDFSATNRANGLSAALCSTGEEKALLIAVLLAYARLLAARHRRPPVLLLDEVAAHLDPLRRAMLFDELVALNLQVWLTGTERRPFTALEGRARFLELERGSIRFDGAPKG